MTIKETIIRIVGQEYYRYINNNINGYFRKLMNFTFSSFVNNKIQLQFISYR